jgi:8-amino-7-oxononanoate synthase
MIEKQLQTKLEQREAQGNKRRLFHAAAGSDFFSNDYLGIATHNALAAPVAAAGTQLSYGATGARLLSGNSEAAEELETFLATFHEAAASLLFNSGYDANLGLYASVADRHTTILYDELCHASIIDGIRLSQAKNRFRFLHNDLTDLQQKLEKYAAQGPVIVAVESVYSMEGDLAPLAEIAALTEQYNAALIVDEAHATGVFGGGKGLVQQLGLQEKIFARVHTFGKAMGCHGAVIVGSNMLKEYLVNFARSFIYTTALPAHSIAAIQASYNWMQEHAGIIAALHERIAFFRDKTKDMAGWKTNASAIQSYIVGANEKLKLLNHTLREAGINVCAVMHPTVPAGAERLRICLHAFNTHEEINRLTEIIATCNV